MKKLQPSWPQVKAKLAGFDRPGLLALIQVTTAFVVTSAMTTRVTTEPRLRMFEHAVIVANTLPAGSRDELIARLDQVRIISHKLGYRVGDTMDDILRASTESGD